MTDRTYESGEVGIDNMESESSEDDADVPTSAPGRLRHLRGSVKRTLLTAVFFIALLAAIVAFAFGVDSLPLNFGEIITFMGIWLALGAILGQNKPPDAPIGPYLRRRIVSFTCTYIAFTAIAVVYALQKDGGGTENVTREELWGLLILSLLGFSVGFFAGQDQDPK